MKREKIDFKVGDRTFGVELEFSSHTRERVVEIVRANTEREVVLARYCHNSDNAEWFVKSDSSVTHDGPGGTSLGGEISSPVMKTEKDLAELRRVVTALRDAGVSADAKCGFHVHVGMLDFTDETFGKFVAHWTKCEAIVLRQVPPSRRANKYCPLIIESGEFSANTYYSPSEILGFFARRSSRYGSINVSNWVSQKRLEIRIMEGTFDPDDVENWIRFLLYCIDVSKQLPMPKDLGPFILITFFVVFNLWSPNSEEEARRSYSKKFQAMRVWFLKRIAKHAMLQGESLIERIDENMTSALLEEACAKKILKMIRAA